MSCRVGYITALCLLHRRKLSQESVLSVGVAASGFASSGAASQAMQGFTDTINDGRLQNQLLKFDIFECV